MAATGLLNSNPYGKAVALDFSTKATNAGIQLIQKEQAKKESLDKYFKDYEKSINSAGMRQQDQNVFLEKMNDAKLYYLQNQDRILMSSKYGAQYQSEYMGKLKEAQTLINESKKEAEYAKVDADHFYQATTQGLDIPDGYFDARKLADLPLGSPSRKSLNPYDWNFTKPFKPDEFFQDITRGITPDITKSIGKADGKGHIQTAKLYEYSPDSLSVIERRATMQYGLNAGVTNKINKLIKTGEFINYEEDFNKLYPNQNIQNATPQQITAAVGIALSPHQRWENGVERDEAYWTNLHFENAKKVAQLGKSNIIVNTGGGDTGTNAPAPAAVIEEVIKLNKNYAKPTTVANLYDITDVLGSYTTKKLGRIDLTPEKVYYNSGTGKFTIKFPADYSEPDQTVSADNYKVLIDKYNPGAKSQKFNGPIKK
jgi:hypothetical protein